MIANNVFLRNGAAINVHSDDPRTLIRNNVFLQNERAFELWNAPDTTDPSSFFGMPLDSDFNFIDGGTYYQTIRTSSPVDAWSLSEIQAMGQETSSLSGDPMLDVADEYRPLSGSPVLEVGDTSVYPDHAGPVNMGRFPFFAP
jgi:hypothetical protein